MKSTKKFRDRLKKDLKDPKFKEAFEEEEIYASLAIQIAKMREKRHLTQYACGNDCIKNHEIVDLAK